MAGDTIVTIVGNLTDAPELRFTASGAAVANFTVASTPRTFDRNTSEWVDGETLFMRCNIWRQPAENLAESADKGNRVIVTGRLKQRSFETKEGDKRTVIELEADEVGMSVQFAVAKPNRAQREGNGGSRQASRQQQGGQRRQSSQAPSDPWGSAPARTGGGQQQYDEPPFFAPADNYNGT